MIKVEIKTNGILTHQNTQCADQASAEAWVAEVSPTGAFGQLDRWLKDTDGNHTDTRIVDEKTEYFFPQTFTVTYTEIADPKETIDALNYLASTDWYCARFVDSGMAIPQEIKDLRAAARLKVINI